MEKKAKKGDIISYHYSHDETLYFGRVLSNINGILSIKSLDAPIFGKNLEFDKNETLSLRITIHRTKNKIKKLLENHRKYGLQEAKEILKENKKINTKKTREKIMKEYKEKVKHYKNLKFFYAHLVDFILPD